MSLEVKLGLMLALFLLPAMGYIALSRWWLQERTNHPSFFTYNQQRFGNWHWRWRWVYNRHQLHWRIKDLTPYCPKCNGALGAALGPVLDSIQCPTCQTRYFAGEGPFDSSEQVKRMILENAQKRRFGP